MTEPEIVVERSDPPGDDVVEIWSHRTDDQDIYGVEAFRSEIHDDLWPWGVDVAAAEFIRDEPFESEFCAAIEQALRGVNGVTDVIHEDRELWLAGGRPTGDALVRAVVLTLHRLDEQIAVELQRWG